MGLMNDYSSLYKIHCYSMKKQETLRLHKNFIHQPNLLNSSLVDFIVYNVQTSTIKFLFNNFLVNGAKQHCMQLVKILTERHIGLRSEASSLEIKPSPFLLKPIRSYI